MVIVTTAIMYNDELNMRKKNYQKKRGSSVVGHFSCAIFLSSIITFDITKKITLNYTISFYPYTIYYCGKKPIHLGDPIHIDI